MSHIYTIYRATNTINGKCYVGFDSHWPHRKNAHKYQALTKNLNFPLYRSIRKHGWSAFVWDVIYQSKEKEHALSVMEPFFIVENKSFWKNNGYNLTCGGDGGDYPLYKRSKEHSQKISIALKGRVINEEWRNKISASNKGRKQDKEWVMKRMSANHASRAMKSALSSRL